MFGDDLDEDILEAVEQVEDQGDRDPNQEELNCLQKYFGHMAFKPLQWKIIRNIMHKKKDQLTVMATGYGKSLIYQVYFGS